MRPGLPDDAARLDGVSYVFRRQRPRGRNPVHSTVAYSRKEGHDQPGGLTVRSDKAATSRLPLHESLLGERHQGRRPLRRDLPAPVQGRRGVENDRQLPFGRDDLPLIAKVADMAHPRICRRKSETAALWPRQTDKRTMRIMIIYSFRWQDNRSTNANLLGPAKQLRWSKPMSDAHTWVDEHPDAVRISSRGDKCLSRWALRRAVLC